MSTQQPIVEPEITKSNGVPRIRPEHVAVLKARAVPIEIAELAGLYSATAEEVGKLLGMATTGMPGLVIPYPGVDPAYARVRMDSGPARYLCPAKRPVPVYRPPDSGVAAVQGDLAGALIIVEAPIKALALSAIGLHVVGLSGVNTTLDVETRRLNDSWRIVALEDRWVVVCFDSGRRTNRRVSQAEARLVMALQQAGARVSVADLPAGPRGVDQGPDDLLAARGADALLKVLAAAVPGDPLDRLAALADLDDRTEQAEKLLDDGPWLAAIIERGEAVRSAASRKLADLKVGKQAFARAIRRHLSADGATDEDGEAKAHPYTNDTGCFEYTQGSSPGPICNFTAEIVEELTIDDGAEQSREFIIEGTTSDGRHLPRISVPVREFASSSAIWVTANWGADAIVRADCMQHIHVAIQCFSEKKKRTNVFQHTGWRRIGHNLVFLTAGDIIGAPVDGTVRLDEGLQRYSLSTERVARETVVEAIRAALSLIEIAPDRITIPGLAAVFRAPLIEWLPCDAIVWLHGKSGAFKSSLAALLLGFYGVTFDRLQLTA